MMALEEEFGFEVPEKGGCGFGFIEYWYLV